MFPKEKIIKDLEKEFREIKKIIQDGGLVENDWGITRIRLKEIYQTAKEMKKYPIIKQVRKLMNQIMDSSYYEIPKQVFKERYKTLYFANLIGISQISKNIINLIPAELFNAVGKLNLIVFIYYTRIHTGRLITETNKILMKYKNKPEQLEWEFGEEKQLIEFSTIITLLKMKHDFLVENVKENYNIGYLLLEELLNSWLTLFNKGAIYFYSLYVDIQFYIAYRSSLLKDLEIEDNFYNKISKLLDENRNRLPISIISQNPNLSIFLEKPF
jgi:hypothetical protein